LIREMAADNPTWGQERIANELHLKLGILVSSRTVAKSLRRGGLARTPDPKQRLLNFVPNHAQGIVQPESCTPRDPAGLIRARAMVREAMASPPTLG
jgi:hypothetical protein